MASAQQAMRGIEKEMVRDYSAGNIERLLGHFHSGVVGFSSTKQERIVGRAAMRKTFDYYRQASTHMKYQIAQLRIQVFDDSAIATFYWTVELGTGRPRHAIHGRGTHVFKRQGPTWRIMHEHFSRAH